MNLYRIAHIKRFIELVDGDSKFLEDARSKPEVRQQLLDDAGLDLDAADLTPFWVILEMGLVSKDVFIQQMQQFATHPLWSEWREWSRQQLLHHQQDIERAVSNGDKRVNASRTRQLARVQSEVLQEGVLTISPLFAFELSMGCSAQCWFCAFDPPPLRGWFAYTEEHGKIWVELLKTAWELFGPGCSSSVCYHATDPTDNPDYSLFTRDFLNIFGALPQTTTARPLKNTAWTREVLLMHQEGSSGHVDRFSVLSTQALYKIHKAFSPEELLNVRMVLHNEGTLNKVISGRTLDKQGQLSEETQAESLPDESVVTLPQYSIECTCGYLVNMVEQSIKLISPCNASEQWPRGYKIHKAGTFRNASDFRNFINSSIEECMPEHLAKDDFIAFREGLQYEPCVDGFSLTSRYRKHDMLGNQHFSRLGELLLEGNHTTGEVTDMLIKNGMPMLSAISWLDELYQGGLLEVRNN